MFWDVSISLGMGGARLIKFPLKFIGAAAPLLPLVNQHAAPPGPPTTAFLAFSPFPSNPLCPPPAPPPPEHSPFLSLFSVRWLTLSAVSVICDGSASSSPVIPPSANNGRRLPSCPLTSVPGPFVLSFGVSPHDTFRICSGRAFAGLFQDFLIVTTCLGYCAALSSCWTQSSLNHTHSGCLRASGPRLLTQTCSVTVGDCSHGTFHNHLKTLWALCAREQICIHLDLCSFLY